LAHAATPLASRSRDFPLARPSRRVVCLKYAFSGLCVARENWGFYIRGTENLYIWK
jgi:hypothetical protein